ncbi:MAG: H-NS histone family protein [Ideonella sp.]|nr:H-NS histone family protein [Ideonella sp.]MCC7457547.1 H-NS histone family protein [Nitrospira sp.]
MSNLSDLLAQKAVLEKQIADAQREARAGAIAKVKALMAEHGLTPADLASKAAPPAQSAARKGRKVAPKYRDPATGATWSGRGLQPNWLKAALAAGRKLGDFAL